jgi:hypothetical protein
MYSQFEYCPKCNAERPVSVTIALKNMPDIEEGDESEVLMIRYHCESCLTFIRQIPLHNEHVQRAHYAFKVSQPSS